MFGNFDAYEFNKASAMYEQMFGKDTFSALQPGAAREFAGGLLGSTTNAMRRGSVSTAKAIRGTGPGWMYGGGGGALGLSMITPGIIGGGMAGLGGAAIGAKLGAGSYGRMIGRGAEKLGMKMGGIGRMGTATGSIALGGLALRGIVRSMFGSDSKQISSNQGYNSFQSIKG